MAPGHSVVGWFSLYSVLEKVINSYGPVNFPITMILRFTKNQKFKFQWHVQSCLQGTLILVVNSLNRKIEFPKCINLAQKKFKQGLHWIIFFNSQVEESPQKFWLRLAPYEGLEGGQEQRDKAYLGFPTNLIFGNDQNAQLELNQWLESIISSRYYGIGSTYKVLLSLGPQQGPRGASQGVKLMQIAQF